MARAVEENMYGMRVPYLRPHISSLYEKLVVREDLRCADDIETAYYAGQGRAKFTDVCFFCGKGHNLANDRDIDRLKEEYSIVRPICIRCKVAGKKPATKMSSQNVKKNAVELV